MQLFDCKYIRSHLTAQLFFTFFFKCGLLPGTRYVHQSPTLAHPSEKANKAPLIAFIF